MIEKSVFEPYLRTESIFKDKEVLRPSYIPEALPHRIQEINTLAGICSAALRNETPSNVFIYGKTGTGKTAVASYIGKELLKKGSELDKKIAFVYINCEIVDTDYGVIYQIGNNVINGWQERVPFTGWPAEKVYHELKAEIDNQSLIALIVLDEIDKLIAKSGDKVLYWLSRMNGDMQKGRASIIGITNDLKITEFLDPRVKSSLGEEELIFPPYNAAQLQDILRERSSIAFNVGILADGVIPLCAALAAQEHGDARKALDLLRVSAEIAENEKAGRVTEEHVRKAQTKIELDRATEVIRTLPTQSKIVLLAIILTEEVSGGQLTTGDVYNTYRELAKRAGLGALTPRRVTDLLSELDMLGIIYARVISKGRYGRTKEISLSVDVENTKKALAEDEIVRDISSYKPQKQLTLI